MQVCVQWRDTYFKLTFLGSSTPTPREVLLCTNKMLADFITWS